MQVVLKEGLDISSLPETLKEDFDQLDRLEGEFRVVNIISDLEDSSPGKGPPCRFCNPKHVAKRMANIVEKYKPTITMSKVILSD